MRYMKAADVLPPDLLAQVQAYIDGEYLYIPRRETSANPGARPMAARRRPWPEIRRSIGAIGRGPLWTSWRKPTFWRRRAFGRSSPA